MGAILRRYLLLEMLVPFVLGLSVFTLVLLIARIVRLVEMVVNRGVPLTEMLTLFSLILPAFLEVTVPMALLLAILLAFGRMSADSEIVAMKTSGISLYQMMAPVAVFTGIVCLLTLWLAVSVRPWSNAALKEQLFEIAKNRASAGFREKVFNDEFPGLVIYVEEIEGGGATLKGILVADFRDPDRRNTVVAKIGMLLPNEKTKTVTLRLLDGTIFGSSEEGKIFQKTDFTVNDVSLNVAALSDIQGRDRDPKEMSLTELRGRIKWRHERGIPAPEESLELHRKFSIPFACIVFALVGVPLGIQPARAVRSRGFSVSLVLIFGYYILLTACETLAQKGMLPASVAMWTPNLLFLALGASLFSKAAQERPVRTLEAIDRAWQAARARLASHLRVEPSR
ncbi:MAG: LPS export ABC transporter permease LptF [Candidatus Binatia bacterium]